MGLLSRRLLASSASPACSRHSSATEANSKANDRRSALPGRHPSSSEALLGGPQKTGDVEQSAPGCAYGSSRIRHVGLGLKYPTAFYGPTVKFVTLASTTAATALAMI